MKKFLLAMIVSLMLASHAVSADYPAFFKVGNLSLNVPLKNLSLIPGLYDFWNGGGRIGAETQIASYKDISLNIGVITSFQSNLPPLISLDYNFAKILPNTFKFISSDSDLNFGIWYARNMDIDQTPVNMAGFKSSVNLF